MREAFPTASTASLEREIAADIVILYLINLEIACAFMCSPLFISLGSHFSFVFYFFQFSFVSFHSFEHFHNCAPCCIYTLRLSIGYWLFQPALLICCRCQPFVAAVVVESARGMQSIFFFCY